MTAIKNKWNSYVGPNDERQLAEMYKIRNKGFIAMILLSAAVLYYLICLSNALGMKATELASAGVDLGFDLGTILSGPVMLLGLSLIGVCIGVTIAAARKGISETNRFGNVDKFPWGYYLLWSAGGATAAALTVTIGRMVAFFQVFGSTLESTAFYAGFALGSFIPVFLGCLAAFYLVFVSSKKRREALEAELDEED